MNIWWDKTKHDKMLMDVKSENFEKKCSFCQNLNPIEMIALWKNMSQKEYCLLGHVTCIGTHYWLNVGGGHNQTWNTLEVNQVGESQSGDQMSGVR